MTKKKHQESQKKTDETSPEEMVGAELQTEGSSEETEQESGDSDAVVELTVEQQLQQELDSSRAEARRNHELYLRTLADMDNLRKRSQREKEDLAKFSNETILREILPVIDNLERAVEHAVEDKTVDGLLEGVQMTLAQFSKVLEKFNVVPVEAMGKAFDPAHHQAMGQIETEDYPANAVAQEMQKGYLLNDRLLRPSMVMIAKAPAVPEVEENSQDQEKSE